MQLSRKRAITSTVIALGLSVGAVSPASAQPAPPPAPNLEVVGDVTNPDMVKITIPGVQIPGLPQGQFEMPKLPGLDQVIKEGPRYAKQIDSLVAALNSFIGAQQQALGQLTPPERQLTDARNNIHAVVQSQGKNSQAYREAVDQFKEARKQVATEAKSGNEEAKAALIDSESKKRQKDASAVRILAARDRLEIVIDRNGGAGEGSTAPEVENGQIQSTNYVDRLKEEEGKSKPSDSSKTSDKNDAAALFNGKKEEPTTSSKPSESPSAKVNDPETKTSESEKPSESSSTATSDGADSKEQAVQRYQDRAASVYSPSDPSNSALYAFGNYKHPIGVPSLLNEEADSSYGKMADMDIRKAIDRAFKKNKDLVEAVTKLRKAEAAGDEQTMAEAHEQLRPMIDAVGKAMYSFDDEQSPETDYILGGNPSYNLADHPADQEKFDQFIIDLLTIPSKFRKEAEANNEKNVSGGSEQNNY